MSTAIKIQYKNYRGEIGWREIVPISVYFGSTEFHPEPQWLMLAMDVDKNANRDFALKDIISWNEKVSSDSEFALINKFEDHYFKRIKGAYIHPDLAGLLEINEETKLKISNIKDKHRNSNEYKMCFEYFKLRQPEIDGLKWHYNQLKSSFIGEVAEQLKNHPTAVSYCCSLRMEIEELKEKIDKKQEV